VHNTRELRCRRSLEHFPEIITRLAGMAERFATALDCADISFLADGTLDELPLPSRLGATRVGGVDLNKPPHPRRPGRGTGAGRRTARLHRRRVHHQGPGNDRAGRLHDPPGRLRLAQAPRQEPHHQARPVTALPRPPRKLPAPSLPCLPSVTRSSARSWPASAALAWDANLPCGLAWTATTRPSASACRPSSMTSASHPSRLPHRQHFVDRRNASF